MLYVIGGVPRCGKTILAKKIAVKKTIPFLPLDYIASTISPYIVAEERGEQLPLHTAREKTEYSNDKFYSLFSAPEIVQLYLRQAETYWPGIRKCIEYALADKTDLVLEGWQILPHHLQSIMTPENKANIKAVFLYKQNEQAIIDALQADTEDTNWASKHTKEKATYAAIAKMIVWYGRYIQEQADQLSLKAVCTDTHFTLTLDALVSSDLSL